MIQKILRDSAITDEADPDHDAGLRARRLRLAVFISRFIIRELI